MASFESHFWLTFLAHVQNMRLIIGVVILRTKSEHPPIHADFSVLVKFLCCLSYDPLG